MIKAKSLSGGSASTGSSNGSGTGNGNRGNIRETRREDRSGALRGRADLHASGAPRRRRRVLLAMEWLDYDLNLGIAKYARSAGWVIDDTATHTGQPPREWHGDGIIALLRNRDSELTRFVTAANVPIVDLVAELGDIDVPRVLADNPTIGRTGAEHLLSCGLHHLGFFNVWDSHVEQERQAGFRAAVEAAGRSFYPIEFHGRQRRKVDVSHIIDFLERALRKLPRPLGMMGQHDREAAYILQACEQAGLRVPEEVAVVGSDNDMLLCELGTVPLSSVDNRRRDHGFKAASLLDHLMNGEPAPEEPLRVPAGPMIVRYSSEVLAVPDEDVSKALQFIANNYHKPIRVQDVVRHVGTTRRRLYLLFEEHLGRPIQAEILRRRLDLARRLLLTTQDKLYSIARACGFQNAQQFTRVFTREVGIAPLYYRKQNV